MHFFRLLTNDASNAASQSRFRSNTHQAERYLTNIDRTFEFFQLAKSLVFIDFSVSKHISEKFENHAFRPIFVRNLYCRMKEWGGAGGFSQKSFFLPQFAMACAARFRPKTTEINDLESVDIPRVSGHQNPTSSDGATASGSRLLSGKSRKSSGP